MNLLASGTTYRPEHEFVNELLTKDRSAFAKLFDNYSEALFGVISRIVPETELAEDILQESFVKYWRHIQSYDSSKGRLFTWMVRIARNTALDKLRSKEVKHRYRFSAVDATVSNRTEMRTEIPINHIGVAEIVQQLAPELLQVIDIVYFKGYTHAEAAKALDLPLGTVKTRVRAAIKKLRVMMQHE